ncbi:MAG: cytochrome c-type biogenesis protein CcmH [Chloroflexota bacterium]
MGARLGGILLLALLAWGLVSPALADDLDDRARAIAKKLQCPVCQTISVADSPSDLAAQMRAIIRQKLAEGWTEEQIINYFVERYGDGVLLEPPRQGFGLLAWVGPAVGVLLGLGIIFGAVRAWRRTRPEAEPALDPADEGRYAPELEQAVRDV